MILCEQQARRLPLCARGGASRVRVTSCRYDATRRVLAPRFDLLTQPTATCRQELAAWTLSSATMSTFEHAYECSKCRKLLSKESIKMCAGVNGGVS